MRVRLIIKDAEYRNALADGIGKSGKSIFVEIAGKEALKDIGESTVILTDCDCDDIDKNVLSKISGRTLFLSRDMNPNNTKGGTDNLRIIFKYSSLSSILAELHSIFLDINNEETEIHSTPPNSSYAICCDGDSAKATAFGLKLARQLIYRTGIRPVMVPLGFINYCGVNDESCKGTLARLFYSIEEGRPVTQDMWIYEDESGIGRIRIPNGINQLAYENSERLIELIEDINRTDYAVSISIIGDCLTENNVEIMRAAGKVFWLADHYSEEYFKLLIAPHDIGSRYEYVELKNLESPLDVWIDNYIIGEYGNR